MIREDMGIIYMLQLSKDSVNPVVQILISIIFHKNCKMRR